MLKDRGNIKWQGMFLPEHVKALREYERTYNKKEMPEIDEQQLEIMQEIICEAMEFNQELEFTYFVNGEFFKLRGRIHFVDQLKKELRVYDSSDRLNYLKIAVLTEIKNL